MTKRLILSLLVIIGSITTTCAEIRDSLLLDQVVVTGTRTPKSLKETPIQTRVITADDIVKTDATNIEDVLKQELPGVEFSYAMNQMKHMNFSGFGGQNVLFLIDGERMAGETMDDIDFSRLNMANVERIEIIKGAASVLYGSNANGGVVNIITKAPQGKWHVNAGARLGAHNEWRYRATVENNGSRIQNSLTYQATNLDTYALTNGNSPQSVNIATEALGEKTHSINDRLTLSDRDIRLTANLGYYFNEGENKMDRMAPWHFRDLKAGLKGAWDMTHLDNMELSYNFDQYDKAHHYRLTDKCFREYTNVQNSLRALFTHTFSPAPATVPESSAVPATVPESSAFGSPTGAPATASGASASGSAVLTIGADYLRDYLSNTKLNADGREAIQHSYDAFAQFDWNISNRLELVSAIRYDHFSDGNFNRFTPKLNIRYNLTPSLTLRSGYGVGFRAPALKEKYYFFNMVGIWDIIGSSIAGYDLQPELSHNFNLSAEYTKGSYNVVLSGFYNNIRNRITVSAPRTREEFYQENPTAPEDLVTSSLWISYINVAKYNTCGIDLTAQARWHNGWGARLSYAYVHEPKVKDHNGNIINNQYTMARPHSINARVEWDHQFASWYRLNAILSGRFVSAVDNIEFKDYRTRDEQTGDLLRQTVHHPAYTLWKLSIMNHFTDNFHLTLTLDNLFNYKPDYYYYNTPMTTGTTVQIGLNIDL